MPFDNPKLTLEMNIIGIRREDKNIWERRAPLAPFQVGELTSVYRTVFYVQPSTRRIFSDSEYAQAGAKICETLDDCQVILGIKEIPVNFFRPATTYLFFAHVIKGQPNNMPMLRQMMTLECSLIDYEKVTDDQGRRLIFFGRYAGIAGAIDTLAGLGRRWAVLGYKTPLAELKLAHEYGTYAAARREIFRVGELLKKTGVPDELAPLIIGVTGYGNVARGVGEILNELGCTRIDPAELPKVMSSRDPKAVYEVVFREEHMMEPITEGHEFDLQEYYQYPERYRSRFESYLPYLSVLLNCIYWDSRYPRLVTREYLKTATTTGKLRLIIIGDISCDINGSVEVTVKTTDPGAPFYVYNPLDDAVHDGVEGDGVVVMAVDNLPCELASDSSVEFGRALMPFVPVLAGTNFQVSLDHLTLPPPLQRALILHRGKLTPPYQYLEKFIKKG